jgi:hypothetical protein
MKMAPGVRFDEKTRNGKLAPVGWTPDRGGVRPRPEALGPFCATTSVSMEATCPATCPWKSSPGRPGACYVESGFQKFRAAQLDDEAAQLSPLDVIKAEARLIRESFGGGPVPQDGPGGAGRGLRLHVAGDVDGVAGTKELAKAAAEWMARGGSRPWSYSHRFREVHRRHWGPIAVLASIENPADLRVVAKQGYAPALVVDSFESEQPFEINGWKFIPCPFEAHRTKPSCTDCRLCWDEERLRSSRTGIAFAVHGPRLRLTTMA